ncbi:MAG: PQQ-binding-like beta-propeller repeat protein [Planctomycetales bacterium]
MMKRLVRMKVIAFRCLASGLLLLLTAPLLPGEDWPSFRGAARTAVSLETGLLPAWPDGGPPLIWKGTGAGRGYASLAIAEGRIFTLGDGLSSAEDKDEYLVCFNRENGQPLWKSHTGPAWNSGRPTWQSSRGTPTVNGERVYVVSPRGELVCCETATGRELWRKNLEGDFLGTKADNWGYSESVLIDGERLVCTPGGDKATMVALNKQTGELLWTAQRPGDRGAGHASIVVTEVGGTTVYVQTTGGGPLGVRASDGRVLWSYPIERTTAVIPTPIVRGDLVFCSIGYKRGGVLLKQVPGSDGEVTVEEVYPLNTELSNKHGGVVLVGDYVFGDSEDGGVPFCAELLTGQVKWKKRGSGQGSAAVAAADGRLYLHFSDGTLVLAKAVPDEYAEISSFKVPGSGDRPSWSHPVILDGRLYIREQDTICCFNIRAQ